MALLKSGSTVGGNLIWHQGILPLFPASDKIYYNNSRIYTTTDRPTTDEINTFSKPVLNKIFKRIGGTDSSSPWYKFGTAKLPQSANLLKFQFVGGGGFNGRPEQNKYADVIFRTGNNDSKVPVNSAFRAAFQVFNTGGDFIVDIGAIETSQDVYDLYVKLNGYSNSSIMSAYESSFETLASRWEPKWELQTTDPKVTINKRIDRVYTTEYKPTKSDVGLGNVTNDAQVKKSGDTMTGSLTVGNGGNIAINSPGVASIYASAGDGNAHLWFQTNGVERGVIWATPNDANQGAILIRAKTTGGTSAGNYIFSSDGTFKSPGNLYAGPAIFRTDGNITGGSNFNGNLVAYLNTEFGKQVSKSGDTMTGSLAINGANGSYLDVGSEMNSNYHRITIARKVGNASRVANMKITPSGEVQLGIQKSVTQAAPDKFILFKDDGISFTGDVSFLNSYQGDEAPIRLHDTTTNLNDLVVGGNYSDTAGSKRTYICSSSGGGANITNKPSGVTGNFFLEVIGARRVSATDFNGFQQLYSGDTKKVFRRYYLKTSSATQTWTAWEEVSSGVQSVALGGTGATEPVAARNNLGLGTGNFVTFNGMNSTGDISTTTDNSMVRVGNNGDIAIVKKNGANGKILVGSDTPFVVAKSSVARNISSSDTQTDIFSVGSDGTANMKRGITGDFTVNGSLYVSTVNSGIYFPKAGSNPRNMRFYGSGDSTRGNRLEITDDSGYLVYFQRHPTNGIQQQIAGSIWADGAILAGGNIDGWDIRAGGTLRSAHDVEASVNIVAGGSVYAGGGGGGVLVSDGNIRGSKWGGWLGDWIGNNFVWKGDDYRNLFTNCIDEGRADGRIDWRVQQFTNWNGAGNVGTYALLYNMTGDVKNPNDILPGGSLRYSSSGELYGGAPDGNWRCMGIARNINGNGRDGDQVSLWTRIS